MRRRFILACATLLCLAVAIPPDTATATDGGLYRATVIVTGREETRREGMRTAFLTVLARVSGDPRLPATPAAEALADDAAAAVAAFSYRDRMAGIPVHDEQGSRDRPYDLTVDFLPARIDAALATLGRKPWPEPRPAVLAIIAVRTSSATFWLTAGAARGRDMVEALQVASDRFALPVTLPDAAIMAGVGPGGPDRPVDPPRLAEAIATSGAAAGLVGTLTWSDARHGWLAEWRLRTPADAGDATAPPQAQWTIEGVSFDAAFRSGVGGAAQALSGNGPPS